MKKLRVPIAGIISLLTLCIPAFIVAQPVVFSANKVSSVLAEGKENTILEGNCKVTTGSITITAEYIKLSGEDFNLMEGRGGVEVVDTERKIRLRAPRLSYNRKIKLTKTIGPTVLVDEKNKLTLRAEQVENDGIKELTTARIAVRIIKDKISCRAEFAIYNRLEENLELLGGPEAYKDGDKYQAARIIVNTKTEDISMEGSVSGRIIEKQKDEKKQ